MISQSPMKLAVWFVPYLAAALIVLIVAQPAAAQQQPHPRQEALDELSSAATLNELLAIHEAYDFPRGNLLLSELDYVGDHDFYALSEHFGSESTGYGQGDLNLDGFTDLADLAIMSFNAGHSRYVADPLPATSSGSLGISLDTDRSVIVSSSSPVHVGALQFASPSGGLSLAEGTTERREPFQLGGHTHRPPASFTPMPGFHWVLSNEPESVVLASKLGWSVTLDGDLKTAVQAETNDLTVRWFEKNDVQIHTRQLGEGDPRTGRTAAPLFGPIIKPRQHPFRVEKPGVPDDLFFAVDEPSLIENHRALNIPRGDLDGDAKVLFSDFLILARFYGQEVAGYEQADLNLDGIVSLADYAILSNNWGATEFKLDPPPALPKANLGLWLDSDGQILITSGTPAQVGGVAVESPSGGIELSPIRQQGPTSLPGTFPFELTAPDAVETQFAWGASPGTSTEIHGTLVTHVTDARDLQLSWFELGSYQVFTRRLGEGDPPNDRRLGFVPYPHCDDPNRDPSAVCIVGELEPVEQPKTFEISLLDEADNVADLIRLHDELNIARGDINGSGSVEFTDLLQLLPNFDNQADVYSDGDLDLNGAVDFEDLAILGTRYFASGFTPSLPSVDPQEAFIYFDEEGKIVIGVDEVLTLGGIEITSPSGGLLPPDDDTPLGPGGPFALQARNDSESVVWFSPGSSQFADFRGGEVLSDDLATEIRVKPGTDDLQFRYYLFDSFEIFTGDVEFPELADRLLGDFDGNGVVDFADFIVLSGNYGTSPAGYADGDINGDGQVEFEDFVILADNFGRSAAAGVPVPEPSGFLMTCWLLTVLIMRQHRGCQSDQQRTHNH